MAFCRVPRPRVWVFHRIANEQRGFSIVSDVKNNGRLRKAATPNAITGRTIGTGIQKFGVPVLDCLLISETDQAKGETLKILYTKRTPGKMDPGSAQTETWV
jgi:hypothetical protein